MGAKNSKIIPLPIPVAIKRIGQCLIPDDRNQLLDLFEMIDINMCEEKDVETNTKQLQESNAMMVMMKVAKRMIEGSGDYSLCFPPSRLSAFPFAFFQMWIWCL